MESLITVTGLVATTPRHIVTQDGLPITTFRLACSQRVWDKAKNAWDNGSTNWYTVTVFRQLAINVAGSVHKGERIIASGLIKVRDWDNGETSGTSVEIEASTVGHDLAWGNSNFTRTVLVQDAE